MSHIPSGRELARPFLPARDFDLSKRFYEALGFEKLLDGDVAIFEMGSSGFILQRYYVKEWAENFMMQLMVDDLDGWWSHIAALDLPGRFGVPAPKPPALQPWGLRVAYVVDPSGVLWAYRAAARRGGAGLINTQDWRNSLLKAVEVFRCGVETRTRTKPLPLLKEYVHLVGIR